MTPESLSHVNGSVATEPPKTVRNASEVLVHIANEIRRLRPTEAGIVDLKDLIRTWVVGQRKAGGTDINFLNRVEEVVDEDPLRAIGEIASVVRERTVHKSMPYTIKALRREVGAGLSESEDRMIRMGEASPILMMGGVAHSVEEALYASEEFSQVFNDQYDLELDGEFVVGFIKKKPQTQAVGNLELKMLDNEGSPVGESLLELFKKESEKKQEPDPIVVYDSSSIRLNQPILAPGVGQAKFSWALKQVRRDLDFIVDEFGSYPDKPSDVQDIYHNPKTNAALVRIVEIAQFLFGDREKLSQVIAEEDGLVIGKNIDEFKTIASFFLFETALERYRGNDKVGANQAVLTEISEGVMSIRYKHSSNGEAKKVRNQRNSSGKADILKIHSIVEKDVEEHFNLDNLSPLPDPRRKRKLIAMENYRRMFYRLVGGAGGEPSFTELTVGKVRLANELLGYMEQTVGSRIVRAKLRRKGVDRNSLWPVNKYRLQFSKVTWDGRDVERWRKKLNLEMSSRNFPKNTGFGIKEAVKAVEKKMKRQGKNIQTLLRGLDDIFGERMIKDFIFEVVDLKYLIGVKSEFSQKKISELPYLPDKYQVQSYLFKLAAQLYRVNERENKEFKISQKGISEKGKPWEYTRDEITAIIKFIRKHELYKRIKGTLLYKTSLGEVENEITLARSFGRLRKQAERAFQIDPERNDERLANIKALQALRVLLRRRLEGVKVVKKEVAQLPEGVREFCIQNNGKTLMSIKDFSKLLERKAFEEEEVKIKRVADLPHQRAKIFWVYDLAGKGSLVRIAVNHKGKFSIDGFGKFERIRGSLVSSEDERYTPEEGRALYELYISKVFDRIHGMWDLGELITTSRCSVVNSDKILFPDGSLRDPMPGKPIIVDWRWDTGGWFLVGELLREVVKNGKDRYDTVRLNNLIAKKARGQRGLLCPMPTHPNLNKKSRAAHYNNSREFVNIKCHNPSCSVSIDISKALGLKRKFTQVVAGSENYRVFDFKVLSPERREIVKVVKSVSEIFAQSDQVVANYLASKRALSVDDMGSVGYVPSWFPNALWNMSQNPVFRELLGIENEREEVMANFINRVKYLGLEDPKGRFINGMVDLLSRLDEIERKTGEIVGYLSTRLIARLADPDVNIIGKGSHWGDGVVMPLYWPDSASENGFAVSNVNVRNMRNPIHWKIKLEEGDDEETALNWKEPTPAGVWARDINKFLQAVTNLKTIYLTEGAFNGATIRKFGVIGDVSEITDNGIATVSTGYRTLYALIRHLGVVGDKKPPEGCLGLGIENVILAPDLDYAGFSYYNRLLNDLIDLFPGVNVLPVHVFLPEDIRELLPSYDPGLFGVGKSLHNLKLDMNDLIQPHDRDWTPIKLDDKTPGEVRELVEQLRIQTQLIRAKYAHIPQK